jgi:transcription elongation factor Elf1
MITIEKTFSCLSCPWTKDTTLENTKPMSELQRMAFLIAASDSKGCSACPKCGSNIKISVREMVG